MDHNEVIENNYETLCDLTDISLRFINRLSEAGALTKFDKIELESVEGHMRNIHFYNKFKIRDASIFRKVCIIMEERDTRQASEVRMILRTAIVAAMPEPIPKHPTSKVLGIVDAQWIGELLQNDSDVRLNRAGFHRAIGLTQSWLFDGLIEREDSGENLPTNFFTICLVAWVGATMPHPRLEQLDAVLRGLNFSRAADAIKDDPRSYVCMCASSCPNQL